MGQHKRNPTAIAAKKGEIKPIKRVSRSQQIKTMKAALNTALFKRGLLPFPPSTYDTYNDEYGTKR